VLLYSTESIITAAKIESDKKTGKPVFTVLRKDVFPKIVIKQSFVSTPEAVFSSDGKYCIFKNDDRLWIIEVDSFEIKSSIKFPLEISKVFQDRAPSTCDSGVPLAFDQDLKILHLFNNHP